jgi:predicted O-methyltransferase YrrM
MGKIDFFHDPEAQVQPDQYRVEFEALLDIYRDLQPKNVLEIGTRHGGTFYQWVRHSRGNAVIVGVDLPGGLWGTPGPIDYRAIWNAAGNAGACVMALIGNSHHPATIRAIRAIMPVIDFLFIDGDHTAHGAEMDYLIYGSMVRHGGVIAFHDVLSDPDNPGIQVHEVWNMVKDTHERSLLLTSAEDQTSRGIGVIYGR